MIYKRLLILKIVVLSISSCTGSSGSPPLGTGDGIVNISWNAPVTRKDGSTLNINEISGYRINYGSNQISLPYSTIINSNSTDLTLSGLPYGTWYFTVQTIDTNGLTGSPSNLYTVTFP